MTDGLKRATTPTASDWLNDCAVPSLRGLMRAHIRAGKSGIDALMFHFRFAECGFCGGACAAPDWRPLLRAVNGVGPPCRHLWSPVGGGIGRNRECLFAGGGR